MHPVGRNLELQVGPFLGCGNLMEPFAIEANPDFWLPTTCAIAVELDFDLIQVAIGGEEWHLADLCRESEP